MSINIFLSKSPQANLDNVKTSRNFKFSTSVVVVFVEKAEQQIADT